MNFEGTKKWNIDAQITRAHYKIQDNDIFGLDGDS